MSHQSRNVRVTDDLQEICRAIEENGREYFLTGFDSEAEQRHGIFRVDRFIFDVQLDAEQVEATGDSVARAHASQCALGDTAGTVSVRHARQPLHDR